MISLNKTMNNHFEQKDQFRRNINTQFEQSYQLLNEETNNVNQFEQKYQQSFSTEKSAIKFEKKFQQSIWKKISTIKLNKIIYK